MYGIDIPDLPRLNDCSDLPDHVTTPKESEAIPAEVIIDMWALAAELTMSLVHPEWR